MFGLFKNKGARNCQLIQIIVISLALHITEADDEKADDDKSRHPYSYKYNVVDEDTNNNYEVEESGNPEIVRGSYRIALPDGRTQVVTYEVHPTDGYNAKVTYEGTAQYPDTPGYVASPYGPPEPIRPQGYERKFKRQSKQIKDKTKQSDNIFNELKPVNTVRSERKIVSNPEKAENQNDLFSSPSQTVFALKHKKVANKPIATPIAHEKFDDTSTSPQAEPLSLQQVFAPKKVHTKKPKTSLRQNLEQNKSNTLNAQSLEQSTDQTIVLPAPVIATQKSKTTPIYDDTFYDSPHIPQAEPLSLQQNYKKIKPKKKPNIQVKSKDLGDIQSKKPFDTPAYSYKYEIVETTTGHITADSTQATTVIGNKNSDNGKDATAADTPVITDAGVLVSDIPVTAPTDSADVKTEAVIAVDTSTHTDHDEIIEQTTSAEKQVNSAPLKGDTSNTIKSVPLLDNTFYETQFLGTQYRPFRAIINTGPSTQHIVNPYEYKIGQNSHKFQALQSQYLRTEETENTNNLVEEEQAKTEVADDIFLENDLDAEYFEDYNSYLFGLRLPSVILPNNNKLEDGNTKTTFRVTNDKEIEASTIKPHDIIRKVRVPKDYSVFRQARALSNNNNYQPVERGARVKFVEMKAGSFVPQYYTA